MNETDKPPLELLAAILAAGLLGTGRHSATGGLTTAKVATVIYRDVLNELHNIYKGS